MKKYLGFIIILALLLALVPVAGVSAAVTKVDVCHFDKDAGIYFLINISDNAFDSHVSHGDAAPYDDVPGVPGMKFAGDCSLVPQKELIQILSVDATAKIVSYSEILISGQLYELKASGVYKYGNFGAFPLGYADAKYSNRPASVPPYLTGWVDGADLWADPLKCYGLQVTIFDGNTDKPLLPVGWIEPYNDSHIYTATFTGTGAPLGLFIWDDQYGDNVGGITVEIWKIN